MNTAGLDRRTEDARMYMLLAEKAMTADLSEFEDYLLRQLQERLRTFRRTFFTMPGEQNKRLPVISELNPAQIPALEEVMDAMERKGWEFHFSSRVLDGHRIYSARAWLPGEPEGLSRKCRDPFPKVALAGAWVEAERYYRARWNRAAEQQSQAVAV